MDVSFRKLTYLVTAARLGTFSSAADHLNVTQPALSRSIAELERHYGLKIFERRRSGVSLTAAGEQIVAEARNILKSAIDFNRKYQLVGKGEAGHVAVGMGSFIAGMYLPGLARDIFNRHPMAEISTLIRTADVLVQSLLESSIELFFAPHDGRAIPDEIDIVELGHFTLKLVARSGHPLFDIKKIGLADLTQFPIACASEVPWVKSINPNSGVFACDNYHIIEGAVAGSNLIWFCPHTFVQDALAEGRVRSIDVDIPAPHSYPVICGSLKGKAMSPLASKIIGYMKTAMGRANKESEGRRD